MRRSSKCLFFIFVALAVNGRLFAEENLPVRWSPQWKVGDSYVVEYTKERVSFQGTPAASNKGRSTIKITVEEKNDDYFVVHWTYGRFELDGPEKDNPFVVKMMNISEGLCLKMKTDASGLPYELINVDEMIGKMKEVLNDIESFFEENKAPKQTIRQTLETLREQYRKPEVVKQSLMNDSLLFFRCCSGELKPNDPEEVEMTLPNPFGGDPFPGKSTTRLIKFEEQSGLATVEYLLEFDKEKASSGMFDILKKMRPESPDPEGGFPELDIYDKTSCRIDTRKGWPLSIEFIRAIKVDGRGGEQKITFKTVKP